MKMKILVASLICAVIVSTAFIPPTNNWRGIQNYLQQTDNVTQSSSITTAVEIDKRHGRITTVASTLATNAKASFVVDYGADMDTTVDANSEILLTEFYTGSSGNPQAWVSAQTDTNFTISIRAIQDTLNSTIRINYDIQN